MAVKGSLDNARVPVLGFIASSGTGKTTLLSQVIAWLSTQGLRIGVIKQARDDFDVDQPGKDSYRLRKAGVERLLLASSQKSALVVEHPEGGEAELNALLALFDQNTLDIILVEGFSEQPFPKIELSRGATTLLRYPNDPLIIALATDRAGVERLGIPVLDLNDPVAVAEFVLAYVHGLIDKRV
jgi:molybdopterin-guanine dinucleotide biosynthesis protein MobB